MTTRNYKEAMPIVSFFTCLLNALYSEANNKSTSITDILNQILSQRYNITLIGYQAKLVNKNYQLKPNQKDKLKINGRLTITIEKVLIDQLTNEVIETNKTFSAVVNEILAERYNYNIQELNREYYNLRKKIKR